MTPEQMRIAIAEKCGWKKVYKGPEPDNRWIMPDGLHYATADEIPDYCNDLNACQEMEKFIPDQHRRMLYTQELYSVLGFQEGCEPGSDTDWSIATATASQRCEAFCRVFWPERFK